MESEGVVIAGLEEGRDLIATAISLGLDFPAISGMRAYEARIFENGDDFSLTNDEIHLGFFPDGKSAVRRLARWVVETWIEYETCGIGAPWTDSGIDADTWLADRTPEYIVNYYFQSETDSYSYRINEIKIENEIRETGPITLAEMAVTRNRP